MQVTPFVAKCLPLQCLLLCSATAYTGALGEAARHLYLVCGIWLMLQGIHILQHLPKEQTYPQQLGLEKLDFAPKPGLDEF